MDSQKQTNTQMEVKRKVSETLRQMKVGDIEEFSVIQLYSVRCTIDRLQTIEQIKFSTKKEDRSLFVTRVA